MNISKVEDFIAYNMAKDLMKQATGDGMEFELMYQAIIDSMQGTTESAEGSTLIDSSERGSNMKLDQIPLLVKGQNNGQIYGIEPISFTIDKDTYNYNTSLGLPDLSSDYKLTSNLTVADILNNIGSIKNNYEPATGKELQAINEAVDKYSKKYGVDKNLVLAIIKQESNFDPKVVSHAGAMGLMQLMDFNCNSYGVKYPLDINQNIEGGVRHIKEYLDMFGGNAEMALMAYNGGPGTMERRGVKSPVDLYKMPKETQNYVPKVLNYYRNGF